MKRRGLTLLELMVATAISAFIIVSVTGAYVTGINFEQGANRVRERDEAKILFESKVRSLISGAFLSATPTDTTSYFVASSNGTSTSGGADTITFTTTAEGINTSIASNTDDDFEALNQKFGPQGGLAEVSISTTAVGEPGTNVGLFLREQRPSDGDNTQGGFEHVLNADVASVGFEFYDGTQWRTEWDTTTSGTRRLPAAVRVTYTLNNDDVDHVIVIRLPNSDVTADNPVTQAAGAAG